ncbi:MAG: adenylate/guanylate cyclase domain-containing protein [Cyclobacteriaceae bacterium]|nr:adenylate/guanylate cyclase domain-containing protein [Cyclobacteriaceae bacterium]
MRLLLITSLTFKKAYRMLGFLFLIHLTLLGQNQTPADSLEQVYTSGNFNTQNQLGILSKLSADLENPEKKLTYSIQLIQLAQTQDSIQYLYKGFLSKGNALRLKSDLSQALESYFEAARIAGQRKINRDIARVNIAIADVYSIMGNHNKAVNYYQLGVKVFRTEKDSIGLASALLNLGDEFINYTKPDSALIFLKESGEIFEALNDEMAMAYNQGNIGMAYAQQGKDDLAKINLNEAISILEKINAYYPISVYLNYISDIYSNQNEWSTALTYAKRSLELAQKYHLKDQISDANLQLSKLYEQTGNIAESFKYYKNYTIYKDSVNNIVAVQQMASLRADFEISQKQAEVDLLNQQKQTQKIIVISVVIALILIALLAIGLYKRNQYIRKTSKVIEKERERSENLLLNILPDETAKELKENGKVQAKKFESVTVLFTDFKEFTQYAENLPPEKLVDSVDFYYSKFDEIMEKYDLEKIKTVGDSYMCAGGLHITKNDHAHRMILAAFDILAFVEETKSNKSNDHPRFSIRIGINTGPVIAGVVGTKKFSYDIWGNTVNVASRMESSSIAGRINISESTYELIKDHFNCEYRGEVEVKNGGMMKMYFVTNK